MSAKKDNENNNTRQKARVSWRKIGIIALSIILLTVMGCSEDDPYDYNWSGDSTSYSDFSGSSSGNTSDDVSGSGSSGDLTTFSIAFDKSSLSESYVVDSEDDDYIENSTIAATIRIQFSTTGSATVEGDEYGIVSIEGNDVTVNNTTSKVIAYELSGTTTDGFFKLYSSKKQAIVLNGANITNPDGAAINNQSKKRTFVVLRDGTSNYLTDGTTYSDAIDGEDMKATFFSEGQLIFSGSGYLEVDGNCKAGIRSDDYVRVMPGANIYVDCSSGNGIRGNDAVIISGGVINVNITGTADKGISTDGYVQVDGGRTTIITSGTYEWDEDDNDYSACACIKADSVVNINGGELNLRSTGTGGKGIKCDKAMTINDGKIRIITVGSSYSKGSYSTSPKGIKADGDLTINGGHIQVRSGSSEGIESKGAIVINGGTVESYCSDDAINSKYDMTINGGYVYAHATSNDGLDANNNIYINGGVVIAEGSGAPECGLDAAEGYNIYINGGIVVALGGNVAETSSSSKQASVAVSVSSGSTVGLMSGTNAILSYKVPTGNATGLMISSPSLQSSGSYTFLTGCTTSGGDSFYPVTTGCTLSGGQQATLTAAYSVGSSMGGPGGGGMPGGGMPGGRW